tara:strand:+ start:404 stop:1216 length:813 start_codon:yes stop_codon:yes gene_type:complete
MVEVWKKVPVEGYERYSISSMGQVRNDDRGRIMKNTLNTTGYYSIQLSGAKAKHFRVNRLVALAFIPNPNEYPYVNHIDGNKENNCVENLEWCTQLYNTQSLNTKKNFGCVRTNGENAFRAEVSINGNKYLFCSMSREKCQDWLNARQVELENNLNLTELDCHKRHKGYIFEYSSGSFQARLEYKTKSYSFNNPNREKCQDWLNARYVEIINGLNLTEIDVRKKGSGSIFLTKSKTFSAEIMIKGKLFRKTFKTREEGERYIEECKRNNA